MENTSERSKRDPLTLGKLLRRRRDQLRLNRDEAARRTGLSYWQLNRLENCPDVRLPRPDAARRLAAGLEIDMGDLFAACGYDAESS